MPYRETFESGSTITVLDNESTNLTLTLPGSGFEGQVFTNGGQVAIGGTLTTNLTVTLLSSDASELQLPDAVTLLAGQTSVTFSVTLATDGVADGVQTGSVTASGAGFTPATGSFEVRDRDVHHFGFGAIATPQVAGTPFRVTLSAQDINGATITVHEGGVALTAAGDHGLILAKPPNVTMTNGVWSGDIRLRTPDTNVRLTAAGGLGEATPSNPFDVQSGPVDHFAWEAIASPQRVDVPFPVTLVAQDAANNLVTGFTNSVALSGRRVEGATSNVHVLAFIRYADTVAGGEFLGTLTAISNSFRSFTTTTTVTTDPAALRTELIGKHVFLVVAQGYAPGGAMGALGIAWAPVLNDFVNSGGIVIACSYMSDEHLVFSNSGLMSLNKLTASSSATVGWVTETVLNTGAPGTFIANYVSQYANVNGQVSLYTTISGGTSSVVLSRDVGAGHVVMIGTDYRFLGTGMDRIVANAVKWAQNSGAACVGLMPTNTGNFVDGVWSGSLAVTEAASNMCLLADDGRGHSGTSGVFTAEAFADLGIGLTDAPDPVAAGSNLTYSVCVSNTGPDKATGVRVSLPLPAAVGFVSASASQGTCARVIDTVIWSAGVVSNGAAATATITVTPMLAEAITNTATVAANCAEPAANNVAGALTTVTGSGRLAVTPASNLCATVFKGGLFSPVSQVYTLTNCGSDRLSWSASHAASWVTLSPAGGALDAYAATEVTAAINAGVKSLAVGTYNDPVLFTNVTTGAGSATRAVELTVQALPAITTNTLANPAFIAIPSSGAANPYPATINVSELSGTVTRVTATLVNVNHIYPEDVDVLLVGPAGQKVMLMSDAGGGTSLSKVTLGFADAADASLPDATPISAGTFRPTDYDVGETLPVPAPVGPYGSSLSVFNGQNPNGAWSLYVVDDTAGFGGSISNGWQLTLTTENAVEQFADLNVGVTAFPDPVTVGSNLVYSICASNSGPDKAAGVLVSNTLPATVRFVSASASQGACSNASGTVVWVVGVLSNGLAATASITVVPTLGGTVTNWATLSAGATDTNLANNSAGTLTAVTGCGVLGVTPDSGLSASGFAGGPFSPASQAYVLTNSGTDTLTWQAACLTGWVSLSATGGTLPARGAATVTVSLNADADRLPAGHHAAAVGFTNLTTVAGSATREVSLTVLGGGVLGTVFAGDNGYAGNMFDVVPKRNLGITALDVNVSPRGQTAEVTVYFREGSSIGHEGSSAGWTLLGARTVIAAGQDLPTFVDLSGNGVAFLRGRTYGLYVCVGYSSGATLHYTQGEGTYENGIIRLISNCGKGDPPFTGGTYASRIWNGSLYYDTELVDNLGISPSEGLVFQGTEGGPFNPSGGVYTLADRGEAGLAWSAVCASNWVTLVPDSGTLLAGASKSVAVTVNAAAAALAAGDYTATVAFSNAASGAVQVREVVLKVWSTALAVALPASGCEGQVLTNGGRVAIGHTLATALTVSLLASDTNTLHVPPQVVINAGQTNAAFDLSMINNSKAEGPKVVTVAATADGFSPGEAAIAVIDDEIASNAVIIAAFGLETNPGWSCEGQWQFGAPTGRGGAVLGNADPLGGFTGPNVFGVNLRGDYATDPGGPYRLTAGPFNFAGYRHVTVQFRRWLNTDLGPYARAAIEVSTNGTDWSTVWSNGQLGCYEHAWRLVEYPLPAADDASPVYVRWSYQLGADAFAASGWNLDDIVFFGEPFRRAQTSRGTPIAWLQAHGLTNFNGEVEDMMDVDGDGHVTWQEYVAGSIPTNRDSAFRARITVSNGAPWVTWAPDLGTARVYTVEGMTNLADGVWGATNAGSRFFRVKVQMP